MNLIVVFALASVLMTGLLGVMHVMEPARDSLTGAAVRYQYVGYVAVKTVDDLKGTLESISRMPVMRTTGLFRGHYYIKIEGKANDVYSATKQAAIHAHRRNGLVYAGIQIE